MSDQLVEQFECSVSRIREANAQITSPEREFEDSRQRVKMNSKKVEPIDEEEKLSLEGFGATV